MKPIVENIGQVVAELREALGNPADGAPYYLYGHRAEMAKKLNATTGGKKKIHTYQRYPAILLKLDTNEVESNGVISYDLNIAILDYTDKDYDANERYENVFNTILQPLYEKFIYVLGESGLFFWEGDQEKPPHDKVDRPFWGVTESEKNVRNYFTDPIDAIEIINLRIKRVKGCVAAAGPPVSFPTPAGEVDYVGLLTELQQQIQTLQNRIQDLEEELGNVDLSAINSSITSLTNNKADKTEILLNPFNWRYPSGQNRYLSSAVTPATLTTGAMTPNTLRAIPLVIDKALTINTIAIDVTVGVAGSARAGIYTDDGNAHPLNLVAGSDPAAFDVTTSGLKTNAVSITLQPGRYWLAINSNVNATIRMLPSNSVPSVLGSVTGTTPYGTHYSKAENLAAMPAVYPSGSSIVTTTPPWIGLRH